MTPLVIGSPDIRDAVRNLVKDGWRVIPVPALEKGPKTVNWSELVIKEEDVGNYFQAEMNVGVVTGKPSGNRIDIDLDTELAVRLAPHFLPETHLVHGRPGKPRSHYWYECEGIAYEKFSDPTEAKGQASIVEIRSSTPGAHQTLVPPSTHPSGEQLAWEEVGAPGVVDRTTLRRAVSFLASGALLARHYPSKGLRHDGALAVLGVLVRGGSSDEEANHFIQVVAQAAKDEEWKERAMAEDARKRLQAGEPVKGWPSVSEIFGEQVSATVCKWLGIQAKSKARRPTLASGGLATACDIWRGLGEIREAVLGKGELEFNEMSLSPTFAGKNFDVENGVTSVRELTERKLGVRLGLQDCHDALIKVAKERPYHPVRQYLTALKWDKKGRLADVGSHVLQLAGKDHLSSVLIRKWAVGAVARVLEPGSKMDSVLVLAGPQGIGKSTFFKALGGAFFGEGHLDLDRTYKDSVLLLHNRWIFEWAELASWSKTTAELVKQVVSQCLDQIRPPYGRGIIELKRTFVLVGTTNADDFLTDPSGNRRFWVIDLRHLSHSNPINIALLSEMRDQLWAEAVDQYRSGEKWWLTPEEEKALSLKQEEHLTLDPWEYLVRDFAANEAGGVTVADVLAFLNQTRPEGVWDRASQMRISAILKRAGYRQGTRETKGTKRVRIWTLDQPGPTHQPKVGQGNPVSVSLVAQPGQPDQPSLSNANSDADSYGWGVATGQLQGGLEEDPGQVGQVGQHPVGTSKLGDALVSPVSVPSVPLPPPLPPHAESEPTMEEVSHCQAVGA